MPEPTVVSVMREFKQALLNNETAQVARMVREWGRLENRISGQIDALAEEIARLKAEGRPVSESQLYRMERYQGLLGQVQGEIRGFEREAEKVILKGESEAIKLGVKSAQESIAASYRDAGVRGSFGRVSVEAVEYMTGATADGGPLFGVLQQRALTPSAVQGLTDNLIDATALGWNPRRTARAMKEGLADGLQKALVIARTEQMRVYRQASDEQYRASGVVRGKKRLAAKDVRTCLACLEADGELMPLEASMYDHPQGRCVTVPVVEGLPEPEWQVGSEWFKTLPEDKQREMMGEARFDAWKAGQINFGDFGTRIPSVVWGDSLGVKSLGDLLGGIPPVTPEVPPAPAPAPALAPFSELGEPSSIKEMPSAKAGITESFIVEWPDGTKAIYKPGERRPGELLGGAVNMHSEVVTSQLASAFGYDAVPRTEYVTLTAEGRTRQGSAQLWIEGSRTGRKYTEDVGDRDAWPQDARMQMAEMELFDGVIGNTDRHGGNWLVDDTGKLWAIDHGLAFRAPPSGSRYTRIAARYAPTGAAETDYQAQADYRARLVQTLERWEAVDPESLSFVADTPGLPVFDDLDQLPNKMHTAIRDMLIDARTAQAFADDLLERWQEQMRVAEAARLDAARLEAERLAKEVAEKAAATLAKRMAEEEAARLAAEEAARIEEAQLRGAYVPARMAGRPFEDFTDAVSLVLGEVRTPNDPVLEAIARAQGFDGLPKVVDADTLRARIDAGGVELWRGITGDTSYERRARVEQFRSGDYFAGFGMYGNGIYAAEEKSVADSYSNYHPDGVLHMALREDAKIVSLKELHREWGAAYSQAQSKMEWEYHNRYAAITKLADPKIMQDEARALELWYVAERAMIGRWNNLGRYAAWKGYDVIYEPGDKYYVILNRTAVMVERGEDES